MPVCFVILFVGSVLRCAGKLLCVFELILAVFYSAILRDLLLQIIWRKQYTTEDSSICSSFITCIMMGGQ